MTEETTIGRIGAVRITKAELNEYVKYDTKEEKLINNIIKALDKYEDYLFEQLTDKGE